MEVYYCTMKTLKVSSLLYETTYCNSIVYKLSLLLVHLANGTGLCDIKQVTMYRGVFPYIKLSHIYIEFNIAYTWGCARKYSPQ